MPAEKVTSNLAWLQMPKNPIIHHWFKLVMFGTLLGILIVWCSSGLLLSMNPFHNNVLVVVNLNSSEILLQSHGSKDSNFKSNNLSSSDQESCLKQPREPVTDSNLTHQQNPEETHVMDNLDGYKIAAPEPLGDVIRNYSTDEVSNLNKPTQLYENFTNDQQDLTTLSKPRIVSWISADFEANYSSNLLAKWLTPGGEPCKDSKTVDIKLHGLDGYDDNIVLSTGDTHEFVFQALDETGSPHCLGGDYFETDLSGEKWKSRPPVKDLGNGTYVFSVQIHPDFAGEYNLTIILLFRHFEGLKFSPPRFAFDKILRIVPIKFVGSESRLPDIKQCQESDYYRNVWSGRWTRHAKNDSCPISADGRYRCQEPSFPCQNPWCNGPLGLLESNGWVYSAHCSFKMFESDEAWRCLNNRWIFWWGDSNHCDTIRNILHFVLDVHDIATVSRIFDMNITNPRNPSQVVRFTSIFNGHPNHTGNYQGLNSLSNEEYRESLKGYFSQNVVPDTIIMNSGLHDGVYWSNIRNFIKGADYAASFWAEVIQGVKRQGLKPPEIIYRTTIATGGYARTLAFNPNKMEAFNGVVLDKLRRYEILDRIVDDFDMTYPWHYDNRCNDGVHYGRAPLKMKWRDGQIGHQYFVDLMLGHVLMNALCVG